MITRLYTRLNGLKTIPFPAAHTRIANIWEYPPRGGPTRDVNMADWITRVKEDKQQAFKCVTEYCNRGLWLPGKLLDAFLNFYRL